jgi:DNA-binding NtrC family response regulator/putative methionine-R-sulfoxide reductase with GAF domain
MSSDSDRPPSTDTAAGAPRDYASELARKDREFQVLQRASAMLTSTLDLGEIYREALLAMDELFEFHHAIILLHQPGTDILEVVASRGYEHQAVGGRVRIGTGVIGQVAQRRRMLYVSNLGQQRAYAAAQRRQMVTAGRSAELGDSAAVPGLANAETQFAIPLMMRDELVGVFSIESAVRRTFTEHERALVAIVANQIAGAVHNARLFDERTRAAAALQDANETLEARVVERTAALERELRVAEAMLSDARSRVEGPLVGDSAPVRSLRDAIAREAGRVEPLLLVGPPGSGREAAAHALHEASGRSGAFIFVSCPELHATSRSGRAGGPRTPDPLRIGGKVELAAGGTLYLDAVHELPSECHGPLADMIAREASGGAAPVRVIASTTREAAEALRTRAEPLASIFSRNWLMVPALLDRRDDVPAIARHFVERHARRLGKVISDIAPESLQRLQAYPWPGNVRELRTVLERAVLVSKSSLLEIGEDLLDEGLAVGSYRLVSQIGSGGMGEVWLGRHRLLARPAAVKLIRHDVRSRVSHERLVRRFQREAQVTSELRSPNTVQLYDFGVNDSGSFYYVMELLNGLDLQTMVARFGPQPASRVIMLCRQACRSLAEAHEHGLVHRDIKPANLYVTRLGPEYDYLKVLDFGIVKDQPGEEANDVSAPNILQGTPAYIAPELVLGSTRIDGRADLYALACAAYYALTGQLVFNASTPTEMLLHHAQSTPVPPSEVSELPIPRELETLLLTCLEKEPGRRIASALELETRLSRVPLPQPWTQADARDWWETHDPDAISTIAR